MELVNRLATRFRTCPVTGIKVNSDSEKLLKFNAVIAVVCFLIGVVAAFGLVMTRWEAVNLLPPDLFYRFLTLHGMNMLIFFIIFFEMAILYFAGPILLNCRQPCPRLGWLAYILMVVGAAMTNAMIMAGKADVLFTSYVPLKAHPLYYLGIILFAVGALIVCGLFMATLVVAKREKTYEGSVPLVTFGALTATIIAIITLVHGAATYIPTFLWSLGLIEIDAQLYRLLFWALGHSSQQINVSAQVSVWYLLAGLTVGGVVLNEKVSRGAFVLYILFISMASAHHLLVDPGFGSEWKIWNTSYAMYLAVLASMVHGFTVPGGIEVGMRLRGYTKGFFEWLRKAPWGDPGFSGMALSIVIFGFLGGITGVVIGTEQINIIAHNTMRLPGHFHATVVGGTALSFMAVTYYVLPLIFQKKIRFWKVAKLQPYVFGGGLSLMCMAKIYMGIFGVPRRMADATFSDAPFSVDFHPIVWVVQVFFGIGGLVTVLGGLMFILVAVSTVFFGKQLTEDDLKKHADGIPQGVLKLPKQSVSGDHVKEIKHKGAKGTMILVGIFFICFVLYYFVNWKILSFIWKIG